MVTSIGSSWYMTDGYLFSGLSCAKNRGDPDRDQVFTAPETSPGVVYILPENFN